MFDTTNQTETFDTMAAESDYSAIFDELIEEAGPQQSSAGEAAFGSETGAESEQQRPGAAQEDEEDIFADYAASSDNQAEMDEEGRYRVVYNGKEMYLTLDELKTNAQKGLNYDHVKGEYDILRAQPGAQEVLGDARKSGLSPEGYLAEQKKLRRRSRVENLIRRGIREKDALYMTDLEDALEGERLKAERKKPFYDFIRTYPDVDPGSIPPRAWELYRGGMDLISAYAMCENERLRKDILLEKQNAEGRSRSVGSAVGNAPGEAADPFLEGLLG